MSNDAIAGIVFALFEYLAIGICTAIFATYRFNLFNERNSVLWVGVTLAWPAVVLFGLCKLLGWSAVRLKRDARAMLPKRVPIPMPKHVTVEMLAQDQKPPYDPGQWRVP